MIQNCFSDRNFLGLIALAALSSLGYAYLAQHVYHVMPCSMCYYERYIYWTVSAISILGVIALPLRLFCLRLLGLIFIIGVGVGLYHLGVEKHWWAGPASCTGVPLANSPEEFLKNLQSRPIARCDQVGWKILGISATILNLIWYVFFFLTWVVQHQIRKKTV